MTEQDEQIDLLTETIESLKYCKKTIVELQTEIKVVRKALEVAALEKYELGAPYNFEPVEKICDKWERKALRELAQENKGSEE